MMTINTHSLTVFFIKYVISYSHGSVLLYTRQVKSTPPHIHLNNKPLLLCVTQVFTVGSWFSYRYHQRYYQRSTPALASNWLYCGKAAHVCFAYGAPQSFHKYLDINKFRKPPQRPQQPERNLSGLKRRKQTLKQLLQPVRLKI